MKTELFHMQHVRIGKDKPQLDDFRLRACKGEMIELLGNSQAGKSAIYRFLLGEERLLEGSVFFRGQTYRAGELFTDINHVVCVGKKSSLIQGLTVAENLGIVTRMRKEKGIIRKRALDYRINLLLHSHVRGIEAKQKVSELSLLQQHMVEILRAVENEADLVYIDDIFETYGQLDLKRMENLLGLLKEKGITILCAKRGNMIFESMIDKVVVLSHGKNMKTFYREDFSEREFLQWTMQNSKLSEYKRHSYMRDEVVLEAVGLSGERFVTDFTAKFHTGEIVGFYDMNNYANVELIGMLVGEHKTIHGNMYLNEHFYRPQCLEDAIAENVGYIPGIRNGNGVVEALDFAENLLLPIMLKMSRYHFLTNARVNRYIKKEYLEEIGVAQADSHKSVSAFDEYVRAQVIMQKWILEKPVMLVCEDICEETDTRMSDIVYKSLEELAKNGTAVVLTSNSLGELRRICDTIYIMNSDDEKHRVEKITVVKNIPHF